MKVTVVPSQVTTVEDRIIGNLGFSQMMLLIVPVFIGAGLFAALPPVMESSPYKYTFMGMFALVCGVLAIRIRGKIMALWIIQILRYNLRPKFYLSNKNSSAHREQYDLVRVSNDRSTESVKASVSKSVPQLELREVVNVYATIDNPAVKLRFETTKKGGLYVRLTEVEE